MLLEEKETLTQIDNDARPAGQVSSIYKPNFFPQNPVNKSN